MWVRNIVAAVIVIALAVLTAGSVGATHPAGLHESMDAMPTLASSADSELVPYTPLLVNAGASYAAGPAIAPQQPGRCGVSEANYGHRISRILSTRYLDVSCSGATTSDLVRKQVPLIPADASVILVSAGGNDYGFFGHLGKCTRAGSLSGVTCTAGLEVPDSNTFAQQSALVVKNYQQLRKKAPHALIVGMSYGFPFEGEPCAKFPLPAASRVVFNQLEQAINAVTRKAVADVGGVYFDTFQYSKFHGPCSTDPWYNGYHGVPGDGISVHPNSAYMQNMVAPLMGLVRGKLSTSGVAHKTTP